MNRPLRGRRAVLCLGLLAWVSLAASVGRAQTNFASAQVITGQWGSVTNDNTDAIPDAGGPSNAGVAPQHPLWYLWTAPQSGEVTLDTLGSADTNGTTLDTVLAVYTGPSISQLIQVGANDDYYPFIQEVQSSFTDPTVEIDNPYEFAYPLPFNGPSILRFNATAGATYYIVVDSMAGKGLSQTGTGGGREFLAGCHNWPWAPSCLTGRFIPRAPFGLRARRSISSAGLTAAAWGCRRPSSNAPNTSRWRAAAAATRAMKASTIPITSTNPPDCW